MKRAEVVALIIVILAFILGWYFYPLLPAQTASHWNAAGQVDGYMSGFWGAFLMPVVVLGMWLMFFIIPRIDPLKNNIEKFRKYFDGFVILILLYMIYIYGLTIAWNLGQQLNIVLWMTPAMAVLFYFIGVMMKHTERNWFVGIRTPWTLSSDKVWEKTHRLAGLMFKIAAVVSLLGVLFPDQAIYFILIPIAIAGLFPVIYSYFIFKK